MLKKRAKNKIDQKKVRYKIKKKIGENTMPKKQFYRNQAETIIKKLQARNMEGYYCENREEAKAKFMELYLFIANLL